MLRKVSDLVGTAGDNAISALIAPVTARALEVRGDTGYDCGLCGAHLDSSSDVAWHQHMVRTHRALHEEGTSCVGCDEDEMLARASLIGEAVRRGERPNATFDLPTR